MSKHDRQHDRNQSGDQSKIAQPQAERKAEVREVRDQARELSHLHDQVVERQQRANNAQAHENRGLEEQHQLKRQELLDFQATQQPDVAREHVADRQAELDALDQFQASQRDQLAQRQQIEQRVLQEQTQVVADLQSRQQKEGEELQRHASQAEPGADRSLNRERRQVEAQQQQERQQLELYIRAQIQALQDHREHVNAQMNRDQGRLQQALYEERPAADRHAALEEVQARQEAARQALDRSVQVELAHLERSYQRTVDPDKTVAEFGDVEVYRQQRRAIRSEEGVRLSENEHIRARINLVLQTLNPETGESPVDKKAYRDMVTLTIPRDMAVEKTQQDMELRGRLKEALQTGIVSEDLIRDMDIQADIERAIQARDKTMAARLAAGRAVDDLKAITDEKIIEAAHLQQSELFGVGKKQISVLREASEEELERYLDEEFEQFTS